MDSYVFTVKESQLRLDQYLSIKLPNLSRSKIQNYIKEGQVKVNGIFVKSSLMLKGEEIIECIFKNELKTNFLVGEKMNLEILYEDDSLAVINKIAGLVVHPGNGNHSGTLLNGIIHHFKELSKVDLKRPGIVHRLDKDTTGAIVIAKNNLTHNILGEQFSLRKIKKKYIAIVWGRISNHGIINNKIGRDKKNRHKYAVRSDYGREAITEFKLIEYYPPLSLIELYPKTGRTHQLRVHLSNIGHPILFDTNYGGGLKNAKSFHVKYKQKLNHILSLINRHALHAYSIQLKHPLTDNIIKIKASLPKDIKSVLEFLKSNND